MVASIHLAITVNKDHGEHESAEKKTLTENFGLGGSTAGLLYRYTAFVHSTGGQTRQFTTNKELNKEYTADKRYYMIYLLTAENVMPAWGPIWLLVHHGKDLDQDP